MNKLTDYILEPGNHLYRYDIVQPPKEWSTVFKNPEYVYPDTGIKNQIDAFFFFNSFEYAYKTAICSLGKNKDAYSGDTRSPIPVISVHSVGNLQYRRQS